MSVLTVNVRVIPDDASQRRPTPNRVREAADLLGDLGFKVLRLGRFGVSVQASEGAFERVLGCQPLSDSNPSSGVAPQNIRLQRLVDSVEVTPAPKLFA